MTSKKVIQQFRARQRVQANVSGPSKTQQSHKETVDINHIIRKFDRTGQLPPPTAEPQYADVSALNQYFGELIAKANEDIATANAWFAEQEAHHSEQQESPSTDATESGSEEGDQQQ